MANDETSYEILSGNFGVWPVGSVIPSDLLDTLAVPREIRHPVGGGTLSRERYPALYAAIGEQFACADEPEGEFRLPDVSARVSIGDVTLSTDAEVREAMRLAEALKTLEEPLTEAMDLLSRARTALDDPAGLPDDEYEEFVDGHAVAVDEEDAMLQVSRNYAIAQLDKAIERLRFSGGKG